ncbi:MAG TPA: sterol desaturase family protein [Rhodocyclaceae bacterium]|nr:sterol desaturase family protein [Rhodocyclaceae bacterium]
MSLLKLEHSKAWYFADFVIYILAIVVGAALMVVFTPRTQWLNSALFFVCGLIGWSLVEYLLHRFILHGLQPFSRWHAEHHDRPRAYIVTPTFFSAAMIAAFIYLPAFGMFGLWCSAALTLGMVTGYLGFTWIHHALHHWRADSTWLKNRKRLHAIHHQNAKSGHYGVTTSFWDVVFRTRGMRDA